MKNIVKALKLVVPIAPMRMVLYLLLLLPGAILPAVMLHMQRLLVDNAANLTREQPVIYYVRPALLLIGSYMLFRFFQLVANQYMEFGYFRYIFMGLDNQIHRKSAQISLEYYDNAQYFQMVQKAKHASTFLVFTANLAILSLVLIFNLLSVGGYLTALNPWLIVFVVLVSVPVILEKLQNAKHQSSLVQSTVQVGRRKKYAFELLSTGDRKKELAHYGASCYVADKYLSACEEADRIELRHIGRIGRAGIGFAGIKAFFHSLSICLMVWLLMSEKITIGGFSVLLTSFSALTNVFTQLFQHAGEIMQTGIMSASFFSLMDLEIVDGTKNMESNEEIAKLSHVGYRYPNTSTYALEDISLSIKKGERIAIVGENGAGKTTLAKLLSGFLLPSDGVMELGGIPRSQLKERSIFENITAVYQDFGRYKLSLTQNVYLGDAVDRNGSMRPVDRSKMQDALDWAGLSISLDAEDMLLGKEFGGIDMSGGQWQRLALARSYYRDRPIVFLDEPTAAIDPLEEMTLYQKLEDLAEGRTVVLVTHRLGVVRTADQIIVLEHGKIVEAGNFDELMEKKGRFSYIWKEQMKWYQ